MRIEILARRAGVTRSTIRFYERTGVLPNRFVLPLVTATMTSTLSTFWSSSAQVRPSD